MAMGKSAGKKKEKTEVLSRHNHLSQQSVAMFDCQRANDSSMIVSSIILTQSCLTTRSDGHNPPIPIHFYGRPLLCVQKTLDIHHASREGLRLAQLVAARGGQILILLALQTPQMCFLGESWVKNKGNMSDLTRI